MGTKVHCESYFPGFYYMRDLNDNSSNSNWPLFCGDKIVPNGQYYNGFVPRTSVDGYSGYDKDTLKQKMLEHEAVFKNQVCELHRLYRIQRDMMEEAKRKEMYYRTSVEPASSSSHQGSQVPSEDAQKWHMAGFPLLSSSYGRTSTGGAENFSSPLSFMKGVATQPCQSPFQNGSTSKDFEALDSRPFKVRKKLFDLQLPADQYEDLEEEGNLRDFKESDISSCTRDGNPNSGAESGAKLFVGKKIDRAMDVSASVSRLKGSTCLADLNEPIQIEEETAPSSVDFQVNDRGWLSHLNRAGSSRGNLDSVTQGYQPDRLPLPSHPGKGMYPSGYGREDLWREGFPHGLESSRSYDQSTNSHLEPVVSKPSCPYPFFSSSSVASSWAHPISSWAKPKNSFIQNLTALDTSTMTRTSHPSASSNEYFGGKWSESSSRQIPGFASESKLNGLSAGFDYLNCNRGDNVASNGSTNHGWGKFPKGLYADSKPVIDINLNETLIVQDLTTPDGKSRPEDNLRTLPWLKPKPVHVKEVSGTSRSELSTGLSSFRSSSNQLCSQNETVRDVNQLFPSKVTLASCHSETTRKTHTQTVQKILGVPIFDIDLPENEPSSHASTSVNIDCHSEGKIVSNERKKGIIDINVAVCEPDEQMAVVEVIVGKEKQKNSAFINHIDLNSCVSDCEDPPVTCSELRVKKPSEIDLEIPVFLESEDDSTPSKEKMSDERSLETKQDEVVRNAAETIVSISSRPPQEDDIICLPSEASVEEALHWFANVVHSCKNDTSGKESRISDEEMDDFEAMTLQLTETREEDYMPAPFVPEIQETGGGNALATRSRRGHSRRGRQRRDFQRDILPGLTSLSRHEVTEDLQTFGGLMRATGHSWNSGFNRRNGGGRGRRRAVVETVPVPTPVCTPLIQQLNTIEAGLEDRSLTGWGKTTRRPRRQRCHAAGGNPPTVALT